ncbi:hypothetical protein B0H10DRAFT_1972910 [Mycena sp. CBHHK59/15]|nr:hypothetical protein B0H10DRAFT_1972910 [Mycena sp. CBHHK59/15]
MTKFDDEKLDDANHYDWAFGFLCGHEGNRGDLYRHRLVSDYSGSWDSNEALAEIARARAASLPAEAIQIQCISPFVAGDPGALNGDAAVELDRSITSHPSTADSHYTSNDAVLDELRCRRWGGDRHFCDTLLPPSVSPATPAQKWLWRQVQLYVNDPNAYPEAIAESEGSVDIDSPSEHLLISWEKWARISSWRMDTMANNTWDRAAQRGFAQAALSRRAMYSSRCQ